MAKRKVAKKATPEIVDTETGEVIHNQHGDTTELKLVHQITNRQPPTREEIEKRKERLKAISKIDPKKAPQTVSKYWEATKGDELTGIFTGVRVLQKNDEKEESGIKHLPAIVIDSLEGEYLCGSMQIVDTFINRIPLDSAVYIKCVESKSNKMKEFDIRLLD